MQRSLGHGKYQITGIIRQGQELDLFVAENIQKESFAVNQLKSSEQIRQLLQSVMRLSEEGKLIYTQESEGICILTPYVQGEELEAYLSIHNPEFSERIRLAKNYIMKLILMADYPEQLRNCAFHKKNVIIHRDELAVNLFMDEKQEKPESLYEIVKSFFTAKQQKKSEDLKIILNKLVKGVFKDEMELYISFQKLSELHDENSGVLDKFAEKKEKIWRIGKRILQIAAICIAVFVLYEMVTALRNNNLKKYVPITQIGTIEVSKTEEKASQEIKK